MLAEYLSPNSFRVLGEETSNFVTNRRVKLDCADDGIVIAVVVSASYGSGYTTIIIDEDALTSNLTTVFYSVVQPGENGNLPNHHHSSNEGDGGALNIIDLADVPSTYSGTSGQYLISTGSGTIFHDLPEFFTNFLDLEDTPSTYSGTEGLYLQSTGSGVIWSFGEDTIENLATLSGILQTQINNKSDVINLLDLEDTPTEYPDGVTIPPTYEDRLEIFDNSESVYNWVAPNVFGTVEVLIVAGGGAGGGRNVGAGGGAGGVVHLTNLVVTIGNTYQLIVGNGGPSSGSYGIGADGEDSSAFGYTAIGGGGGGGGGWTDPQPGHNGGSGGGGAGGNVTTTAGGLGTDGQGYGGGTGYGTSYTSYRSGGGGGGAGGVGSNASTGYGGDGGVGKLIDITGEAVYYGGGGGGATNGSTKGYGGSNIGGDGGAGGSYPSNGVDGTGSGGGGVHESSIAPTGAGGSGIIILKYTEIISSATKKYFLTADYNTELESPEVIFVENIFTNLEDTPSTYSGTSGQYLMSNGSGIVFQELNGFITAEDLTTLSGTLQDQLDDKSEVTTFLNLSDTPTTYSGSQYLRTTTSGIEAIDGIILKAPNESEWMIKVTNSGTLYTVEV